MVARQAHNLKVAGSNPAPATRFSDKSSVLGQFWHFEEQSFEDNQESWGLQSAWVQRILHTRVDPADQKAFLFPKLRDFMPDPLKIPGMEQAVDVLSQALRRQDSLAIWGDYDVDGTTSTALWLRYLRGIGHENIQFYIPHRFREGYGLNCQGLKQLRDRGVRTVIVVDSGTVAFEPLAWAADNGLDVIVIDHHNPADHLPICRALVNPKLAKSQLDMGLTHLAAVGVTFMVLVALNRHIRLDFTLPFSLMDLLDLVALGTVCDVVPLVGLNRIFVTQGLKAWGKSVGLEALQRCLGLEEKSLNASDLGFRIGPRINAAGRMDSADQAVELLTTCDQEKAENLSKRLDYYNFQRKDEEAKILAVAMNSVQPERPYTCVSGNNWHGGVIGIIASRLKDRFPSRPSFVIAWDEKGVGKGSARSIPGLDMGNLLHQAVEKGLLQKGGGHAMAGGFQLDKSTYGAFRDFLDQSVPSNTHSNVPQTQRNLDGVLGAEQLKDRNLISEIRRLEPFGAGNPELCLCLQNVRIVSIQRKPSFWILRVEQRGYAFSVSVFSSSMDHPLCQALEREDVWHMVVRVSFGGLYVNYRLEDLIQPGTGSMVDLPDNV